MDAVAQEQHRLALRPIVVQRLLQRGGQIGCLAGRLLIQQRLGRDRFRHVGECADANLVAVAQLARCGDGHRGGRLIAAPAAAGVARGHARRTIDQDGQQRLARRRRNPLLPRRIQQHRQRHGDGGGHQRYVGHQRPAGKRRRPATAYQPNSAAAANANGAHRASGIRGSKVMCAIGFTAETNKAEVSPKIHTTQATATHFQKSSRCRPSSPAPR